MKEKGECGDTCQWVPSLSSVVCLHLGWGVGWVSGGPVPGSGSCGRFLPGACCVKTLLWGVCLILFGVSVFSPSWWPACFSSSQCWLSSSPSLSRGM